VTGAVTVTRDPYQGTLRRCGYRNLYAQTTISKWVRLDLRRLDLNFNTRVAHPSKPAPSIQASQRFHALDTPNLADALQRTVSEPAVAQ